MHNRCPRTSAIKGNMIEHTSWQMRKRNKSPVLFFLLVLVSCGILLFGGRQLFLLGPSESDQKTKTKNSKKSTMRGADFSKNSLVMKKDYPTSYRHAFYNKLPAKRVAVIIVNYNMPERTNDLVIQIKKTI